MQVKCAWCGETFIPAMPWNVMEWVPDDKTKPKGLAFFCTPCMEKLAEEADGWVS